MAHSFPCLFAHIIFSTKNRAPLLTPDQRPRIFEYMGGILRGLDGSALLINGVEDHVHVLAKLPATRTLADILRDLKGDSSAWINTTLGTEFGWQTGYAAFSVSKSNVPEVQKYIAKQEAHHRVVSFREEYLEFLKKHEIQYDPRFVFDGEFAG
jgi:putative transposase